MKYTVFIIVALLAIGLSSAADIKGRITNGKDAAPREFPSQAALITRTTQGSFFCGGSLIFPGWVLTAAHCVDRAFSAMVGLGMLYRDFNKAEQIRYVGRNDIYGHKGYNRRTLDNDIALIKLLQQANITDSVQTISLPPNETVTYENSEANATGWGRYSDYTNALATTLQVGALTIGYIDVCRNYYGSNIPNNTICCSTPDRVSTCSGDSGGPLTVEDNTTGEQIIVGVTSFGSIFGCAKGYPIGFTRVGDYLPWIEDTIKNN